MALATRNYTDNSSSIQAVYQALAPLFPVEVKQENGADSLKVQLFKEIVGRSIADVSGHLNLPSQGSAKALKENQRITIGRVFKGIEHALGLVGVTKPDDVMSFFLGNVSGYTKTIVQTPHPTEMLSGGAINAEEKLMHALESNASDLFKNPHIRLEPGSSAAIQQSMQALYDHLSPPPKMLVSEEMRRSVVFSERMFDAVPMIADRILHESGVNSHELDTQQLKQFGHLVQPMTWSPGDQDSKPLMTVEELKNGFALNKRAMLKHYAVKLATIYDGVADSRQIDQESKDRLVGIIRNLLATAQGYEKKAEKQQQAFDSYIEETLTDEMKQSTGQLNTAIRAIASHNSEPHVYNVTDELMNDINSLRNTPLNFNIKSNGHGISAIGAIDALMIQAENFGLNALKAQIRQNQDKHSDVFKRILSLLPDDMKAIQSPAELLEALRRPEVKQQVRQNVEGEITRIKQEGHTKPLKCQGTDKDDAYVYQVLKSIEFATEHPDFIPHYMIAECGGPDENGNKRTVQDGCDDMLKVQALITIMQPADAKHLVEVTPLVEHPYQVTEDESGKIPYVEMMKMAFENEDFRRHQQRVSDSNYQHLLTHTTVENGKIISKPLTGTDVIASINPEFGTSSCALSKNDQPITMAKLCMGAGSDVTKFGGVTAAAMMQHAMYKLKEELAGLEKPVYIIDYLGCGGGVHRTQPVANSAETVQGRSMRQTPDAIATKTTALLARAIRDRLASILTPHDPGRNLQHAGENISRKIIHQDRDILAQLNMGNLANLPRNPSSWDKFTKAVVQQSSLNYQAFTQTAAYHHMLSYTADIFCKMTSYAARPTIRLSAGAGDENIFPPEVKMDGLRAIGYGGALNVSGSCASLYVGLGNIADIDTETLVSRYKYDHLLQDSLNRATYGIVMSDMDIAWQYVGRDRAPNHQELQQLASAEPPADNRKQQAEKALAQITLEREKIGKKLVELHSRMQNNHGVVTENWETQLLEALPSEYASQLSVSKANLHAPRQALAGLFKEALQNPQAIPDISSPDLIRDERYTDIIYPAMATIFESFEHAPRALTSPNWGLQESRARTAA